MKTIPNIISFAGYLKMNRPILICFLGNPGKQYEKTRHNAGWMVLPHLIFDTTPGFQGKFNGSYAKASLENRQVILLKPGTLMNNSGKSVAACMNFFKFSPEEILVVHDDLELEFGEVRLKTGGGLGGHNGLKSIVQSIGSRDFHRLRFGISRPSRGSVSSYVLSRFSPEEEIKLGTLLQTAAEMISHFIR